MNEIWLVRIIFEERLNCTAWTFKIAHKYEQSAAKSS